MSPACDSPFASLRQKDRSVLTACFILVSFAAASLNTVAASVLLTAKSLRKLSHAFTMSLVAADLTVGVLLSPLTAFLMYYPAAKPAGILSKVFSSLDCLLATTGLIVSAIAYDRLREISRPQLNSPYMTTRRRAFLLAASWIIPLILIPARLLDENIFTWVVPSLYVACYSVLITCYLRLASFLGSRLVRVSQFDTNKADSGVRVTITRQNQKATRLIAFIFVAFIGCSLFTLTYRILMKVDIYKKIQFLKSHGPLVNALGQLTFQLNSALNPILYFFMHSDMRNALRKLWSGMRPPRKIRPFVACGRPGNNRRPTTNVHMKEKFGGTSGRTR